MIRKNDLAGRALAVIRLFNGAGALFVPETALKRLGGDPAHDGSAVYPLRMVGVRTVLLVAELLVPRGEERRRAARRRIVVHGGDVFAAAAAGLRGPLPARVAVATVAISSINTYPAVAAPRP